VDWKRTVNAKLVRATGYELRRSPRRHSVAEVRSGDRLVAAPVFILCTLRSGSTLLRVLLNSHSQIHGPHELHLRYVSVTLDKTWSKRSMKQMGLDASTLEYLLWDRLLHRELSSSGKRTSVDKTPNNVFMVDRIRECWPDARFLFLLRHPAAIARSRQELLGAELDHDENVDLIRRYCEALERARETYDGITVRYEELTADPRSVTQRLCGFLGVEAEPGMLEYGNFDHGPYRPGLGDPAKRIKTGRVQPASPPPENVPEPLREMCVTWGYARDLAGAASS